LCVQRRGLDHAGGVDEDLDWAERLPSRRDQLEGLTAIGEIGHLREDTGAVAPQLRAAGLDPLGGGGGDRDARAEAREQPGRRETDSLGTATASDERVPAGEVEGIVCHYAPIAMSLIGSTSASTVREVG
jgi:hypothetical protein